MLDSGESGYGLPAGRFHVALIVLIAVSAFQPASSVAQTLEQRLLAENADTLIAAARSHGDAKRGAVLFYQPYMACMKCHTVGRGDHALGPNLAENRPDASDEFLVDAVLRPSKVIRKGYASATVFTDDGKSITGLIVSDKDGKLTLRDVAQNGREVTLDTSTIDERVNNTVSIMPAGQVNQLASRQQFVDLLRYLIEIRDGGPRRAKELEPPPALYAAKPLPEYEKHIDHAGIIADFDDGAFERGAAIYNRLCINCHGTHDRPGSLPTSLKFASGQFKNGSDPYTMYQTLTRGFGMMVAQQWMVPQQKYDVVHYIREAYLKSHNPSQYAAIDTAYLKRLPAGNTRGPEPSNIVPWEQMDYGHNLIATYEVDGEGPNFAYKGIATRLDPGAGGVSRGQRWMIFDHDTLRAAAAWTAAESGSNFIDWNGINFNGRHAIHPKITGDAHFLNPVGPGWANPETGTFEDPRIRGRDDRPYGPLPREWAHYKGLYHHRDQVIVKYTVGTTDVLEMPGADFDSFDVGVFTRTFRIGPRDRDMILQVAQHASPKAVLATSTHDGRTVATLATAEAGERTAATDSPFRFDGATFAEVRKARDFDLTRADYTITARIKTRRGGSIFCKTQPGDEWVPNGKTLFVRGGRLCFDIGWVGVVTSGKRVDDNKWHDIAMSWERKTGQVQLYVDGKPDRSGVLKPKRRVNDHVVRVGFSAPDFPRTQSHFDGEIEYVRFYKRTLTPDEIAADQTKSASEKPVAEWKPSGDTGDTLADLSGNRHNAIVIRGAGSMPAERTIAACLSPSVPGTNWESENGSLRLTIPAGDNTLNVTLRIGSVEPGSGAESLVEAVAAASSAANLTELTGGGPPRWPERLKTRLVAGSDDGPFAADVLNPPTDNPWFAQTRLTGFDFFAGGKRMAVSSWDGDVWVVDGIDQADGELTWQRIASGLFQPLGVRIVEGTIYVSCRDQIVVLHDLNGDGETDFYENFNNDHQVTEHFHEFAMGLQTDDDGNFYYAKSARHALKAVVPHHGTLLRVSRDGSRTDILATGFRAANGVCLNPDGSFIVTDQEGHWNPKNRINWVREGGFYGNMFGYHDVTDSSDDAMQQPLCWITNAFDRSPAELLWVDSDAWGPLKGSLLNLSYGYGQAYVVPHEEIGGQMQGGMSPLPLPRFPTGIMRGRFHPTNGQLYTCGMFAWAGNQQQPGGFYRVRYTGRPVCLPIGLHALPGGMEIRFSGNVDPKSASDPENYSVKTWSLKRTASYGSKHYDETPSKITNVSVSSDRRTVFVEIEDLKPTWSMEIKYEFRTAAGKPVDGVIHNTIHALRNPTGDGD